jgi:hypothetical protein
MVRLNPTKLNVRYLPFPASSDRIIPRRYTLTHSDRTGDLFLTIGPEYDRSQIQGWYTRLMRDEVLAELVHVKDGYSLHVYCEVSRGFGTRRLREGIFRRELPLVLEAIRYGDRSLFDENPQLEETPVLIHFCAKKPENECVENWGVIGKYAISLD